MFERFTDRARNVLVLAQGQANELGHNYIGTEHILLGMILEGEGVAAKVLRSLGITDGLVRAKVMELTAPELVAAPSKRVNKPPFTPLAKKALESSLREALSLGHNYIGTEHLLIALASQKEGLASRILTDLGTDSGSIRANVLAMLASWSGVGGGHRRRPSDEVLSEMTRSMVDSISGGPPDGPEWSPATREVMAVAAASVSSGEALTTTDLLAALVRTPLSRAGLVLARLGLTRERLDQELQAVSLAGTADQPVAPASITVLDRTTVVEDPEVARFLGQADAAEITETLRRGLRER